jgi:hypothetical protein
VRLGDVVDELQDDDGLADAGAAEGPALPPLMKGQMRSMTLMPVSRIWALVSWSTSAGAGRWIGYLFSNFTGPLAVDRVAR